MPAIALPQRFTHCLLERAVPVRVLFLDVDGVLTDGSLYFGPEGEQLKRFHTLDGHGIKLLMQAGVTPAVITGRDSPALRVRLAALGVQHAVFGTEDKLPAAESLLAQLQLQWHQAAAIGDDWPDLPVLTRTAFAAAPPGAHAEVLTRVHYVTQAGGGQGAVRELCDLLLSAHGLYGALLQQALNAPDAHRLQP
ncbi:3-deoxy-D-manno-octulosonate 8-phosphate phosphatase [Lampropedia cohaerens]|uniref:3-deoxy-D-manno-octulosonate 8-phosphate phosphatase KdsC n=1 Tax=Lampropedia cohaerens TaxID=1610491 RepID=A0A0U1PWB2_9BURK|nr:3-deoxy-D-manno-octulosonate 8-phosphate phosphatase [Lampropedia cohaerens]KKW66790.1 3-deoxy-D-manno-octulosonate 8-phosphate phosphatase [Lampropedia cohaerens]